MTHRRLSRRGAIRLLSYMCALLAVMSGFIVSGYTQARAYRDYIEQDYQHSFFELANKVGMIDAALQKGMYAASPPMITQLAAEISREAASAQASLAKLPFRFEELENTSKFLSQSGDFAGTLAKAAGAGEALSGDNRTQLGELSRSASELARNLGELQTIISEENLKISEIIRAGSSMSDGNTGLYFFVNAFKEMEEEFPETPSLIYDGPFSGHMSRREPVFLTGKAEVTSEEAGKSAHESLGLSDGILSLAREVDGVVPLYCYEGHLDGGEISVSVTKRGGVLYSLLSSRDSGDAVISPEEGVAIAAEFLASRGFGGMKESYWTTSGNYLLVNFAYLQGDTLCYPDLIKVGVALDTGKIVQFDAAGYVMNHPGDRELPEAKISEEEARGSVTGDLSLESVRRCVIPSPGASDVSCYELACSTSDGAHVMIYVNTQTGFEEKILILIEDDTGTLAY